MQADKTRQELIDAQAALEELAATLRGTHARKANLEGQASPWQPTIRNLVPGMPARKRPGSLPRVVAQIWHLMLGHPFLIFDPGRALGAGAVKWAHHVVWEHFLMHALAIAADQLSGRVSSMWGKQRQRSAAQSAAGRD